MDEREVMAVLSEPTRFRIVQLLAMTPRTVGEVAESLGALQPQTTKHLQALAAADLVTVHRLGRRRVAALRRDTLSQLARWLDGLAVEHPSEPALGRYHDAIRAEEDRAAAGAPGDRTITLSCDVPSTAQHVWRAWTTEDLVRRWWAPEHFEVVDCDVDPTVGGALRIVMAEGDGATFTATGKFVAVDPPRALRFELSPLGTRDAPLFRAMYALDLAQHQNGTTLTLTIDVTEVGPDAVAAVAGVEIGWQQLLARLSRLLVR